MTTSSEIEAASRSSGTRNTVPSRMSLTIGLSASERAFHAFQWLFTLRQTRLTVSLPTAPPKQGTAHAARLGTGEVSAGNQRVGNECVALIGPQTLDSSTPRSCRQEYSAGARRIHLAEASQQRPRSVAVAMTSGAGCCVWCFAHNLRRRETPESLVGSSWRLRRLQFPVRHGCNRDVCLEGNP
jgi:hypothetical protein